MSRWGKPTKNTKHRDPRYFLNENIELDEEINESPGVAIAKAAEAGEIGAASTHDTNPGVLPMHEMQKHLAQYAEAVHGAAVAQKVLPRIMSGSKIRNMMEDLIEEIGRRA
jgi:hypothetical protein